MPTAQMKGESPNCRNHMVLPIHADGLYWGAVGIKSCFLCYTHNATQRENFMATAQMKGESPNFRNHRVLPIPADGLYWGAVGIKSCLYVTHNATQRENFMQTAQMKPHPGPHPRGLNTVSGCGNASCRLGARTWLAGLARCTRTQCAVMENPSSYDISTII